ncbi:hypothetical protein ESCO_001526 [Escovopsis weberi]|uniref:DUF7924 domain-containing protein n=1 Tax=Escovopsis weberi TaxID=150374 RepID=A0A0M9VW76_ESCWE|nr:hypothetical protein ESCO_001526 [Escovopsis weberi]
MERLYARKKVLSVSGGRKRSNSSAFSTTPSDQRPREEKAAPYRDLRYERVLKTQGIYMGWSNSHPSEKSLQVCRDLLHGKQLLPQGSIFDEAVAEKAFENLRAKNEARVIQDLSRLLVPSAETLALYSQNSHLVVLSESVNEGWNNSIPMCGSRPQPDYAVGFGEEAFTKEQMAKLSPFIGEYLLGDTSFFMATFSMYFPFLSCEVKCGAAALVVADRQNAHSMALAVRGVAELFRLLGRGDEVNRQILAFSISHDHETARIYGHYPVIDGQDVKYFRHAIKTCNLSMDREDRWTPHRFTRNVYDIWMPEHLHRLRSAIDQLPLAESEASLNDESTGLSQSLEGLARPDADPALIPGSEHSQSDSSGRTATPTTSVSKSESAKRKKITAKTSNKHT